VTDYMEKTEALVKKAKALGADEVIASTTLSRRTQIRFSNNEVDISKIWHDYVTDVALAWQKRIVVTQIWNFQDAEDKVEDLYRLAKVSTPNPMYGGITSGSFTYPESSADARIKDLEDPTSYVERAIEAAKGEVPEGLTTGGAFYSDYKDVYLVSSEGPMGRDARSSIEISVRAFSQQDASGHGVSCSSSLDGFDPEAAGRKAGEIAWLARDPVPGAAGSYDVVFDPLFTGSLLGIYAMMSSAFYVMIQMSIFGGKIGEKVAPEFVTVRDTPAGYSVGNRLFDDEGFPSKENVIIDEGILKTHLHNTSTAKLFNAETTGNAGLVFPQPWNIELDPGDQTRDALFREMGEGLYLTNTWYTRFQNYAAGDFSTIPRDGAFLIEDGEIKGSVKDIRISDNALRMLGNIKALSEDREHINWWESSVPTLAPYMLIKGVKITKPE